MDTVTAMRVLQGGSVVGRGADSRQAWSGTSSAPVCENM
jgi:hypothetical protein